MPGDIPNWLTLTWLLVVWALQSGVDTYFTNGKLPPMSVAERFWTWGAVNAGVTLVLVLLIRLSVAPLDMFLLWSRDQGVMSLAVLGVVVLYFLWALPFVFVRGNLVLQWKGLGVSEEKGHLYWGYVWVGSVVTIFFNGFLYVAYTIVLPLMQGVEEAFSG